MIPLILSNSSISVYLRCHYQWFLSEVWRLPSQPSGPMLLGQIVHGAVETLHKTGDFVEATETMIELFEVTAWPVDDDKGIAEDDAATMLLTYHREVFPTFKPTLVEVPFVVTINGAAVSGVIDAADEDVRDLKTTAALTGFRGERHRLQLSLYALGYKFLTGKLPRRTLLDVLTRNNRYKQIEVKPDYGEVADVLAIVSEGIGKSDYEPTGAANGSCRYCPFNDRCQFSTTRQV